MDYPLELPLEACLEHIEAKPFSADFDEQLEAAEALYGIQLQFHFSKEVQREWIRSRKGILMRFGSGVEGARCASRSENMPT